MKFEAGFCNLWMILFGILFLTAVIMKIATAIRGTGILNREDHSKGNIIGFIINFLLTTIICIFTPIVTGIFFWSGLLLLFLAGILYICSIIAFLNNKNGLTVNGIYSFTRNPMYVAMLLLLTAFILMSLQSNILSALLLGIVTAAFIILIHKRIINEEKYLTEKYRDGYIEYQNTAPRYFMSLRNIINPGNKK